MQAQGDASADSGSDGANADEGGDQCEECEEQAPSGSLFQAVGAARDDEGEVCLAAPWCVHARDVQGTLAAAIRSAPLGAPAGQRS